MGVTCKFRSWGTLSVKSWWFCRRLTRVAASRARLRSSRAPEIPIAHFQIGDSQILGQNFLNRSSFYFVEFVPVRQIYEVSFHLFYYGVLHDPYVNLASGLAPRCGAIQCLGDIRCYLGDCRCYLGVFRRYRNPMRPLPMYSRSMCWGQGYSSSRCWFCSHLGTTNRELNVYKRHRDFVYLTTNRGRLTSFSFFFILMTVVTFKESRQRCRL